MNINKVIANGSTIVDLTDTTATANDVKLGKIFHTVDGATATGLLSSGLEYEEGTYTPEEDIAEPLIYFANNHSEAPSIVIFQDMTETAISVRNTNGSMVYIDMLKMFGRGVEETYGTRYAYATGRYYTTYWTSMSYMIVYGSDNPLDKDNGYARYTATETYFKAHTFDKNRYWRTGRTYKWIAIWK